MTWGERSRKGRCKRVREWGDRERDRVRKRGSGKRGERGQEVGRGRERI